MKKYKTRDWCLLKFYRKVNSCRAVTGQPVEEFLPGANFEQSRRRKAKMTGQVECEAVRALRVLIVEDERALGMFLKKTLENEGHRVGWVGDGESALELIENEPPDLLVLDLSLPRKDGVEVLERVQQKSGAGAMAVLVLTGRGDVEERVRCLDLGADDFLMKPFSFNELVARCKALVRRRNAHADPMLRCGELALNRMTRHVQMASQEVALTTKEFALLEFMLLRRGECVTRGELLEKVWQMSPTAGTNVVDVYINYLRRKLAVTGEHDGMIQTVRGSGYRIVEPKRVRVSDTMRAEYLPAI